MSRRTRRRRGYSKTSGFSMRHVIQNQMHPGKGKREISWRRSWRRRRRKRIRRRTGERWTRKHLASRCAKSRKTKCNLERENGEELEEERRRRR